MDQTLKGISIRKNVSMESDPIRGCNWRSILEVLHDREVDFEQGAGRVEVGNRHFEFCACNEAKNMSLTL
jgi:hypothetical protein